MPRYKATFSQIIRDYFTFTKWQRRAIVVLLLCIAGAAALPTLYQWRQAARGEAATQLIIEKETALVARTQNDSTEGFSSQESWREPKKVTGTMPASYFPFDPNTASEAEWLQMGLRPKTVQTILNYRNKGGRFRKPEDLLKIYSLPKEVAQKLIPYVSIAPAANERPMVKKDSFAYRPNTVKGPIQLDINTADTTTWIALPGIGSKLAARIVAFREKLGGFYSINQVSETFALPDSTFQKIRGRLVLNSGPFRLINLNTASVDELKTHPYIRWNMANAIVQYRQQHGPFASLAHLQRIAIVTPEWLEKVQPYFTLK